MSYKCIYSSKKECDGCGVCRITYLADFPEPQLMCDNCRKHFVDGEDYYRIKDETLCKECVDELYKFTYEEDI